MTHIQTANEYVKKVQASFEKEANPENALPMKKYMRDQFEFLGIKTPERRQMSRTLLKKESLPPIDAAPHIVKELWALSEREYQYFALELIGKLYKKMPDHAIELFEYIITTKPWWDTIDAIAKNLVGEYFIQYPMKRDTYIQKWIESNNIWLQRTAILFQLAYKDRTDTMLLFAVIEQLRSIDEFFIQKAIGWALREHSKTDPALIEAYIQEQREHMSPLSVREGLKVISK